ncbi:hypothetical protein LPJ60_001101 [Coemansia sp. RSA 2675]|uniref:Uncharacterized protein n=1 Tax=Coemansia linderi TaxID=2663919 RepID=A0ACC1KLP5_9FUNG|nr:hypothetical protein LPJ60_001101 [Coemansia sp. RSA 2675]KAJ2791915.1 hypothetical protein GGI18_000797 [Coemansia linderi]
MELPGVGGKCQLDGCGVLDFLPVRELTAEQALALEAHQLLSARVGQKATIRISEPRKSPKIELMRLKAKATGNPSIDVDDRIYLCIKHKTKSLVVFEAKRAVIGNAAERFAKQLGLSMTPGRYCRLRVVGSDQPLPPNGTFGSELAAEADAGLYNGCTLELDHL